MPRKRSKIIFCKHCKKDTMWYRSVYCPECRTHGWHLVKQKDAKPVSDRTVGEILTSQQHKRHANRFNIIRLHARNCVKRLNIQPKCLNCQYGKHVEVCHIKPIKSFSTETKISEINCLTNITLLCPNCHWEFDNNLILVTSIDNALSNILKDN